jgi:putative endopeptidase
MLENVDWLSAATREKAIEKLDHLRIFAVYPDEPGDWSGLDFPGREENGNLVIANTAAERFKNTLKAARIDQPVNKDTWDQTEMKATEVNAYYDPSNNSINILAGILHGEFYNESMTEAQILGGIGTVIGHEISHAFDTNGAQFDKDGAVADWWTDEDYAAFRARAAKLAAWYDGFIPFEGANYSGQKVQGEAIADMAGMKCILALAARKENFDYNAFFEQYAKTWRMKVLPAEAVRIVSLDMHPMNYMRINATLAQYDEFIQFYGIRPGDGMYIAPEDRVAVW